MFPVFHQKLSSKENINDFVAMEFGKHDDIFFSVLDYLLKPNFDKLGII